MSYAYIISVGVLLTLIHNASHHFHKFFSRNSMISFSAGVSLAYIFLDLLPDASAFGSTTVFVSMLIGFSIFHLMEKMMYVHGISNEKRRRELHNAHNTAFFIYHFIVGIAITGLFSRDIVSGLLFVIPVALHTLIGTASLESISHRMKDRHILRIALSSSTLLGVIVALIFPVILSLNNIVLGFVVGVLMFVVIKDSLPEGKRGKPIYFILGIATFLLLTFLLWKIL